MDSSVSPKEEIWFLRVSHHISNAAYKNTSFMQCNRMLFECSSRWYIWWTLQFQRLMISDPILRLLLCTPQIFSFTLFLLKRIYLTVLHEPGFYFVINKMNSLVQTICHNKRSHPNIYFKNLQFLTSQTTESHLPFAGIIRSSLCSPR